MAYQHGVYVSEETTSLTPMVEVSAGIPLIIGTAPVGMTDPSNVNKPVLCYNYKEAVAAFGFVPAKEDSKSGLKKYEYTISEFIKSQFALFGVGPAIIVNVLNPAKHKVTATTTSITLDAKTGAATIAETGIIPSSVTIAGTGAAYVADVDFVMAFDEDGNLVISSLKDEGGSFLCTVGEALTLSAEKTDPTQVTADDIVGGVNVDGKKLGLELVNECFSRFRLVPGMIIAPGFSGDATVAAVMAAKASNINEHFKCQALIDVPTGEVKQYSAVAQWKNENNIVDPHQEVCWPLVSLDGVAYHKSTQLAALEGQVDSENDDVPFVSPSNHNFQMTASVIEDGTEIYLGPEEAAYLNGQGIVTALNFVGGWKCWGNRTACYPSNTDVKDAFIPIRRMFNWCGNTVVQSLWGKVDSPTNTRLINQIVDSLNVWLNGLTAKQYILGGRIEFLDSDNTTLDVMDGKIRFRLYLTPPSPAREISVVLEYDPSYVETLFG